MRPSHAKHRLDFCWNGAAFVICVSSAASGNRALGFNAGVTSAESGGRSGGGGGSEEGRGGEEGRTRGGADYLKKKKRNKKGHRKLLQKKQNSESLIHPEQRY